MTAPPRFAVARSAVALVLLGSIVGCSATGTSSASAAPSASGEPSGILEPVGSNASDASRLVARFLEVMASPDLRYRTTQTTTISVGGSTITQVLTGEVAAPDVHLAITVTGSSSDQHSEVAVVGGTAYQRLESGPWQVSGNPVEIASIGRAFGFLEGDVLADAGRELVGGSFLRHLTLRESMPIDDAVKAALAIAATDGTLDSFDLDLDSDGTPVAFRAGLSLTIDLGGTTGPTDVQAEVVQTYEDVGGDDVTVDVTGLP